MHSNNNELVKAGHDLAKALSADAPLTEIAKMITILATQLDVTTAALRAMQSERDHLAAQLADVVAENVSLKKAIPPLKMVNSFDDSWDDVSIAEEIGFNHAISTILRNLPETPATDRFLAEQRASGVSDFCNLLASYAKVEPEQFDPHFADLYAKIANRIFSEAMDNPEVYDLETLSDWLERESINSRAYADISIKHHEYNAQEPAQ